MDFTLDLPINGLSFGQTAINILREIHRRGENPCIFPLDNRGDLGSFEIAPEFKQWLEQNIGSSPGRHKREQPTFKLWHLNHGSLLGFSNKRVLMTFHETDSPTPFEINIAANQDAVLVTSTYTKSVLEAAGLTNLIYVPLGFDSDSFFETHKTYSDEGIISFGMGGKFENRKHHAKMIKAWVKRYGNNQRYRLNLALANGFLDQMHQRPNVHREFIAQACEGKQVWNINPLNNMKANKDYNEFLNANNIYLGMSGGEGFDLPVFQSACLGKHIVALRAHVYPDYLNDDNAVLVSPNGMVPVYDNTFFHPGQPFNQGNIFTFDDDEFIAACEAAEARFARSRSNKAGKKLKEEFTWARTVDGIMEALK